MSTVPMTTIPRERTIAMAIHIGVVVLAVLTSWAAGIAGVLAAGVVLAVKPMNSQFIVDHAKEAFNFNLTMFLLTLVAMVLLFFTLGFAVLIVFPLGIILGLVWLICSISAGIAANKGQLYRYPFSWRVIR